MADATGKRIESIDILKGLVMVIMALDHVRDYFHYDAFFFDPADPVQSNMVTFFTRWITHFCAPAFSLLAGMSAWFISRRRTKNELSSFLVKRGLWLIFIELIVIDFAWTFDFQFRNFFLATIWSLGVSMIVLALVSRLPRSFILAFSLALIFGHNALDNVHFAGNWWWSMLHEMAFYELTDHFNVMFVYPLIPWIAVMSLGFYMGAWFDPAVETRWRKRTLNILGAVAIGLFFVLRWTNIYGDPTPFTHYTSLTSELISFFNPNKYPPSLVYLLMTLGPTLIFIANSEKWRGSVADFFRTFGRVPFFYYILHLYLMHLVAMIVAECTGFGWRKLMFSTFPPMQPGIQGYGYGLWVVYVVWIGVVILLYPLCKRFDRYKQAHREKWWLSYL